MSTILQSIRDILSGLKLRFIRAIQSIKYRSSTGYLAEKYWTNRLTKHGMTLKGVGRKDLTPSQNESMYLDAQQTFLSLCNQANVDFGQCNILDIGCGNGYYASVYKEHGGTQYMGIDITDVLFDSLQKEYKDFEFSKLDVSTQPITGQFDLIIMIDVAQHITEDEKFSFAMQNIRKHLKDGGVFIVTADLSNDKRNSFYERSKSMEYFKREFDKYFTSEPMVFRDKFIFFIRK